MPPFLGPVYHSRRSRYIDTRGVGHPGVDESPGEGTLVMAAAFAVSPKQRKAPTPTPVL